MILTMRSSFHPNLLELLLKDDDAEVKIMALEHAAKSETFRTIELAVSAKPETKYIPPPMDVVLTKDDVLKELTASGTRGSCKALCSNKRSLPKTLGILLKSEKEPSSRIRNRLCQNELMRTAYTPALEHIAPDWQKTLTLK